MRKKLNAMVYRRSFLKGLAMGTLGLSILPPFSSCASEEEEEEENAAIPFGKIDLKNYPGKILILGAGASGLYAGHILHQQGVDFEILEASEHIGGRIRKLEGFADFPIELGAEEIHGTKHNLWWDLIKKNAKPVGDQSTDYISLNNTLLTDAAFEKLPATRQLENLVENIWKYKGANSSVSDYLKQQNIPISHFPYANAIIGNEYGTDNESMYMQAWAEAENLFYSGEDNVLLKGKAHSDLLNKVMGHWWETRIRLNEVVQSINYQGEKVRVTTATTTYVADKVLLTVPLSILKKGTLGFSPALPKPTQDAIETLQMGKGMKIILGFDAPFWPSDLGSLYTEGLVPEYWLTSGGGRSTAHVLTAFVHGQKAATLSAQGEKAHELLLKELDELFAGNATKHYQKHFVMDWGKEEFIGGSYSFPSKGAAGMRALLSRPVEGKLFFAGEHCNTRGHFGTVHGAMEAAHDALVRLSEGLR